MIIKMKYRKIIIYTLIFLSFSIFSCVQFGPPQYYQDINLPSWISYEDKGNFNLRYDNYLINDLFIYLDIEKHNKYGKLYYLEIVFVSPLTSNKKYTSFLIKDLQIISKSGIDYSDQFKEHLPINVSLSPSRKRYITDDIKITKFEDINVVLVIEVNTENTSDEKTIYYNFKAESNIRLIPVFILPFA